MAKVGSLVVDLALESAQFIAGLKQASAATTQAANSISSAIGIAKKAAGGLAGALTVDAILGAVQNAFDYGDALVDLADRTGATTKTIQELRYAAQMSGSSMESADAAVEKFSKNLGSAQNGNKAFAKTFADLGVTSRDTDTALRETMDGISKLETVTARNQKTTELFGKSAGDLTVLMGEGTQGFNELALAAQAYGIVIEDKVLRSGGAWNDQLDTMKMVLNAQMASVILQNADALIALAGGFMQAASAAVSFFQSVRNDGLIRISQGIGSNTPVARFLYPNMTQDERERAAKKDVMKSRSGRSDLYDVKTREYNQGIREGLDPKSNAYMQALKAEREDIAAAEVRARRAERALLAPPPKDKGALPVPTTAKPKTPKASSTTLKTDDELIAQWERAFLSSRSDLYRAQANLTTDPTERQDLEAKQLRNSYFTNDNEIKADTGTDQQVREGKKRYTDAQAKQLRQIEKEIFDAEYDATIRDRDAQIADDRLDLALNAQKIEADTLSAEMGLARSTQERKEKALSLVKNQFDQERLQLEHTIELAKLGKATKAEREAAEARLKALPALKALAEDGTRRQNQSPLEAYLDAIPQTKGEINDALEDVQVEGLQSLQDGLMGVIDGTKSVGDAFSDMSKTIINGLIKIGLQQAIIKPLGGLLFGGGDAGGSGLLGSLLGGLVKGARANGGMTGPGNYLVGERGPEVVNIGANANVTTNRALRSAANDNRGGVSVHFGSITSNDPVMVKALAMQAAMEMAPMFQQQAVDATMKKLRRPGL